MKKTAEQIMNELNRVAACEEVRELCGELAETCRQGAEWIREKYENSDSPIASKMLERAEMQEMKARALEAIRDNNRKAYEEAAAGASGHLLQTLHDYALRGLDEEEETAEETTEETAEETTEETAEETTEETKTIAQQIAEKREEREKFEAFKNGYLKAHPRAAAKCRALASAEMLAADVRRDIEAAKRGDEMAAHGPAGIGPHGLPMYYADGFSVMEAPEYLERIEEERKAMAARVAKVMDNIRRAYNGAAYSAKAPRINEKGPSVNGKGVGAL